MHIAVMNREILRIALPAIVANITIPLLGLIDTAIAGHLGSETCLGAIAVASMIFNLLYWNFGFLRMSTSGLTAQAFGRGDEHGCVEVLRQACVAALTVSVGIIVVQAPLLRLALWVIDPSPGVGVLAARYYHVCVWGAPPVLLMMAAKGWLLGIQDSRAAMLVSIVVNVLNIVCSLVAVYLLGQGFMGIAMGTLAAEWLGLAYTLWLVRRKLPKSAFVGGRLTFSWSSAFVGNYRRFFSVSGDIFVRSFLLMLVNLAVTAIGARSGDLVLAANSLIQQLNTLFAYFLDGIAFAGEALVGKYFGSGDRRRMRLCVRRLFVWAAFLTAVFTVFYTFPQFIFSLLTDKEMVIATAMDYRWWCAMLPLAGMAAFVWDGVFIGLTRTRGMLTAVAVATVIFAMLYAVLPSSLGNHRLWLAFVVYLATRGIVQTVLYKRVELQG